MNERRKDIFHQTPAERAEAGLRSLEVRHEDFEFEGNLLRMFVDIGGAWDGQVHVVIVDGITVFSAAKLVGDKIVLHLDDADRVFSQGFLATCAVIAKRLFTRSLSITS